MNDPTTVCEVPICQPTEGKYKTEANKGTSSDYSQPTDKKLKKAESIGQPIGESSDALVFSVSSNDPSAGSTDATIQELRTPLLGNGEPQDTFKHKLGETPESQSPSPSRSTILLDKENHTIEEDESRRKRMGRKARMLDLGKKMGEKLEEKRRHIEEKSRNIVEKMRGPRNSRRKRHSCIVASIICIFFFSCIKSLEYGNLFLFLLAELGLFALAQLFCGCFSLKSSVPVVSFTEQ